MIIKATKIAWPGPESRISSTGNDSRKKMIIESSACETKSLPLSHDTINDFEPSSPAVRNSLLLARIDDTGNPSAN